MQNSWVNVTQNDIRVLSGSDVAAYLDDVARLRIDVFSVWPYLYAGDAAYERHYLDTYARSASSVFVLAFDGDRVVGASTAIALDDETDVIRQPFLDRGMDTAKIFYFGESVLLHAYRGRGIGHRFFDERERHASSFGTFFTTAFCSVERDADDARRPDGFRGNDVFWRKRGYQRDDDLCCVIEWPEIGMNAPVLHRLRFWTRAMAAP